MLSYTEVKPGKIIVVNNEPHQVLAAEFLRMQQRKAVVKTKLKNLISGKVIDRNLHQSEYFEEADMDKVPVKYLYNHRGKYWFAASANPAYRFSLAEEIIGDAKKFLKPNSKVTAVKFNGRVVNIEIPVKVDLEVIETPPGEKGDTASGGRKPAVLETGAVAQVPLFINIGDIIRVNTQTGEYTERVEKK